MRRVAWCVLPLASAGCGLDALGRLSAGGETDAAVPGVAQDAGGRDGATAAADGSKVHVMPPLCDRGARELVACFGFEGQAFDESGGNSSPIVAANLTFVAGREGLGVRLSLAPKSDLRLPHVTMNTPRMTIETWLRPEVLPPSGSHAMLVDMNGRFGVSIDDAGYLYCRRVASTTQAAAGVWTHLACVHDGATLTTYVNGQPEAAAPNTLSSTSDFVGIGQNSPEGSEGFDGVLDNLRIWTEPRDATAVAEAASR